MSALLTVELDSHCPVAFGVCFLGTTIKRIEIVNQLKTMESFRKRSLSNDGQDMVIVNAVL